MKIKQEFGLLLPRLDSFPNFKEVYIKTFFVAIHKNFSAIQILREINVDDFGVSLCQLDTVFHQFPHSESTTTNNVRTTYMYLMFQTRRV